MWQILKNQHCRYQQLKFILINLINIAEGSGEHGKSMEGDNAAGLDDTINHNDNDMIYDHNMEGYNTSNADIENHDQGTRVKGNKVVTSPITSSTKSPPPPNQPMRNTPWWINDKVVRCSTSPTSQYCLCRVARTAGKDFGHLEIIMWGMSKKRNVPLMCLIPRYLC